jgi:hypothetical protein
VKTPHRLLASSLRLGSAAALAASLLGCSAVVPNAATPLSTPPTKPATVGLSATLLCQLKPAAQAFAGTCQVPCSVNALAINFEGEDAKRACAAPVRTVDITLARTAVPGRWLGTLQGVQPEDPTRLEVVPNKPSGEPASTAGSVARTPYGWFVVTALAETPEGLRLQLDTRRQVRPTADDIAIIDRALALLPSAEVWNKNDNRQCPSGANKLSLFCALMQATTELSGGVHYRQPAMQAVREELNVVDATRIKTHRIMDYNNHPSTTLAEVHALLQRAKSRVASEVR